MYIHISFILLSTSSLQPALALVPSLPLTLFPYDLVPCKSSSSFVILVIMMPPLSQEDLPPSTTHILYYLLAPHSPQDWSLHPRMERCSYKNVGGYVEESLHV